MRKIIFLLLLGILILGCEKSDSPSISERNVVSDVESVEFEELLLLLNIKTTDSTYLVVKSIDSVNIFINNNYWAKVCSEEVDTTKVEKYLIGNIYNSKNKLNYLILSEQDVEQPEYSTLGDYAQFLTASYELKAGEYACFIESLQVTFNDNSTRKYYPFEYKNFKVEDDSRSAFVGEIEIKIY